MTAAVLKNPKVNFYGIEVDPEVTWKGWEPGQKYTKKLILKNVKFSTQKLNFRVPDKDVFMTTYPKTITLSAGTSFTLPITFRPDEKAVYEDKIEFQTTDGELFVIPVKALLPQFSVTVPERVSCGVAAAHDVASVTFTLKNDSELETPFRWDVESPFKLEPAEGFLSPHGTIEMTVRFEPPDAKTYTIEARCCYGSKYKLSKPVILECIAKYPHVVVNVAGQSLGDVLNSEGHIVVDFSKTSITSTKERMIMIQNPSAVRASVVIKRSDNSNPHDWVFSCPITEGFVPPKSSLNLMLSFTPKLARTKSVEYFTVRVSNKCGTMSLKCVGESDGPVVTLSSPLINFYQLEPKEKATQPLEVINSSGFPIAFQFVTDPAVSVFHLSRIDGIIPAKDKLQVVVTFRPHVPIQYYRRIVCLVPDQDPLFLDLLGTCHDIHLRPHIIQAKHLARFQKVKERGLSYFPPEQLHQYLTNGKLSKDEMGALMMKEAEDLEPCCYPIEPLPAVKEYFFGDNDSDIVYSIPHVSADRCYVTFSEQCSEVVAVKNNTKGPIILDWTDPEGRGTGGIFAVEPAQAEIPPDRSFNFTIHFKPNMEDRIFGCELEAFARYKVQREFQISDESTIAPPFCLTLRCIGHTFPATPDHLEPFLAEFEFDRAQVVFPSVNPKEAAFRSLAMANTGHLPMLYRIDNLTEPFSVKPKMGVLEPGRHQIFTLRCEPTQIAQFMDTIKFQLNNRPDIEPTVPLLGSADKAEVLLENDGELYFMPTNVGNSSQRVYSVKNVSRVPVTYEWKVRTPEAAMIAVEPRMGSIQPNECLPQTWTFTPAESTKYVFKPVLVVRGRSPSGLLSEPAYYPVRLVAQGDTGSLQCMEEYVDCGTIVVGSSMTKTLTLFNESQCAVYYRLVSTETVEGPYPEEEVGRDPPGVELSEVEGCLPARCKKTIRVTVRTYRRVYYQHKIEYFLTNNPDDPREFRCLSEEPRHLSHLLAMGVYPILRITDIQGTGSARGLSKGQLWSYFSLDNFNVCLDSDPSASELIYTVSTRQSYQRRTPVYTRAVMDLNFGAAPVDAEDSQVHLLLENPGHVTSQFHFLLPDDLQLELEYWAETGEYTHEELHQMKVEHNRLFKIHPRKGSLEPGQNVVIQMTYHHVMPGTDRLPVLMKIDKGREILLNFVGVTVHPQRPYIHFPSRKHIFAPTPIGEARSPVQLYELYNGGDEPLRFHLDLLGLDQLTRENHDVPVLECLTSEGSILPGRTARVLWKFAPLEAKTYMVDIPIHVEDGDTAVVTFTGIGYDKRQLGDTITPSDEPGQPGVPSLQSIPLANQLVYLSEERLSLGNLPLFARARRVVFLNNKSFEREVTFAWYVTSNDDAEYIQVSPQTGRLSPNESILCHVNFVAKGSPRFFDLDLVCEVTDETEMTNYQTELAVWKDEVRKQREEFTITEETLRSGKMAAGKSTKAKGKGSATSTKSASAKEETTPRYKTLPAIKAVQAPSRQRGSRNSEEILVKPQNPRPFRLHLGVTGRTYTIEEFQTNFPDLWAKQFIDRTLLVQASQTSSAKPLPQLTDGSHQPSHCSDAEGHVVESVLSSFLRGLLDDADFRSAITQIPKESVPYYVQLPETRATKGQAVDQEWRISDEAAIEDPMIAILSRDASTVSDVTVVQSESGLIHDTHEEDGLTVPLTEGVVEESMIGTNITEPPQSRTSTAQLQAAFEAEKEEALRQRTMQSPGFAVLVEGLLENMLANIVSEANSREFDTTARPRLIALPARKPRSTPSNTSRLVTPR